MTLPELCMVRATILKEDLGFIFSFQSKPLQQIQRRGRKQVHFWQETGCKGMILIDLGGFGRSFLLYTLCVGPEPFWKLGGVVRHWVGRLAHVWVGWGWAARPARPCSTLARPWLGGGLDRLDRARCFARSVFFADCCRGAPWQLGGCCLNWGPVGSRGF